MILKPTWVMVLFLVVLTIGLILPVVPVLSSTPSPASSSLETSGNEKMIPGDRMRVTFLNPGISDINNPTGTFWLRVSSFMQAAAQDLGIDLEIIYSERDHILMQRQAQAVAARPDPPDYVIVVNEKLAADEMVRVFDRAGIKVFLMLNTFSGEQAGEMGVPREKYRHWIGSLIPDNITAGYMIAKRVIDSAVQAGLYDRDGKIHLVAFAGDYVTPAAIDRNTGLERAVREYTAVKVDQIFIGKWSRDIAGFQMRGALQRYPETAAVWAANDPMALGAMEAACEAGRRPGRDIIIGGLNWDAPALEKVRAGDLATSVGGHFMTGAWTLVLLYDYHHGKDFSSCGTELKYTIFSALDHENVTQYLEQFGDGQWRRINFTKFSRVLNTHLVEYAFSLQELYQNSTYRTGQ